MNGEIWFVGKDVADILGYVNHYDAIVKLVDRKDKKVAQIAIPLNNRYTVSTIMNEHGVDSLISSSKLTTAKEFKHWLTSEVLQTI